jgi:hypothetical protein
MSSALLAGRSRQPKPHMSAGVASSVGAAAQQGVGADKRGAIGCDREKVVAA